MVTKRETEDQFSLLLSKHDKSVAIAFEIGPFLFRSARLISAYA